MQFDLLYDSFKGIYLLNGVRVILLPRGSLELMQDYLAKILGLATKTIISDSASVAFFSFLSDLIDRNVLKRRKEAEMEEDIFSTYEMMGLGKIGAVSQEFNVLNLSIASNFNSALNLLKPSPYCFAMGGILEGTYKLMLQRDVKYTERRCKTTGGSDIDAFSIEVTESGTSSRRIQSEQYQIDVSKEEHVSVQPTETTVLVNSFPMELVPSSFFPYLFSKLRTLIGPSAYGIEYNMGVNMTGLLSDYDLSPLAQRYSIGDFEVLSPLMGIGSMKSVKGELGYLQEIDLSDSFNALHLDDLNEKRCALVRGLLTGLSYKIAGANLNFEEKDCSAINNQICRFGFV